MVLEDLARQYGVQDEIWKRGRAVAPGFGSRNLAKHGL